MVDVVRLSIYIGAGLLFLGIVSFVWHYLKEKKEKQNPNQQANNPYGQQQYPQYTQQNQYPQQMGHPTPNFQGGAIHQQQYIPKNPYEQQNPYQPETRTWESNTQIAEMIRQHQELLRKVIEMEKKQNIPQPMEKKTIVIDEIIPKTDNLNFRAEIAIERPQMTDEESIRVIETEISLTIEKQLKQIKSDLTKKGLKSEVSLELI